MKISIAMATYNGEKYLQEQLDSFVNQTRLPDELVVSDDCSSDGTAQIIQEFEKNAPFEVRIFCNERNLGHVQNFNRAITQCDGDYIFLSDQDDIWDEKKIDCLYNKLKNHDSIPALVHSDFSYIDSRNNVIHPSFVDKINKVHDEVNTNIIRALFYGFCVGCTVAINRKLVNASMPFPEIKVGHDHWLLYGAILNGKVIFVNEQFVFHRVHKENTAPKFRKRSFKIYNHDKINKKRLVSKELIKRYRATIKERDLTWLQLLKDIDKLNKYKVINYYLSAKLLLKKNMIYSLYILKDLIAYNNKK